MLGPFDYALWITGFAVGVYLIAHALYRRQLSQYIWLYAYVGATALTTLAHFYVLRHYGFTSRQYFYTYYYTECLLAILLFLVVTSMYLHVFRQLKVSRYLRVGAIMLLLGVAGFSYMVVRDNATHLTGKFVLEISQNIYFVGAVLTYGLWGAVMKMRESRARLVQLVLALGIYFSAFAALYALRVMFPKLEMLRAIPPILGIWLQLAWAYTFTRIPEGARLAPATLAGVTR